MYPCSFMSKCSETLWHSNGTASPCAHPFRACAACCGARPTGSVTAVKTQVAVGDVRARGTDIHRTTAEQQAARTALEAMGLDLGQVSECGTSVQPPGLTKTRPVHHLEHQTATGIKTTHDVVCHPHRSAWWRRTGCPCWTSPEACPACPPPLRAPRHRRGARGSAAWTGGPLVRARAAARAECAVGTPEVVLSRIFLPVDSQPCWADSISDTCQLLEFSFTCINAWLFQCCPNILCGALNKLHPPACCSICGP